MRGLQTVNSVIKFISPWCNHVWAVIKIQNVCRLRSFALCNVGLEPHTRCDSALIKDVPPHCKMADNFALATTHTRAPPRDSESLGFLVDLRGTTTFHQVRLLKPSLPFVIVEYYFTKDTYLHRTHVWQSSSDEQKAFWVSSESCCPPEERASHPEEDGDDRHRGPREVCASTRYARALRTTALRATPARCGRGRPDDREARRQAAWLFEEPTAVAARRDSLLLGERLWGRAEDAAVGTRPLPEDGALQKWGVSQRAARREVRRRPLL